LTLAETRGLVAYVLMASGLAFDLVAASASCACPTSTTACSGHQVRDAWTFLLLGSWRVAARRHGLEALLCIWFVAMTSPVAAHAIARGPTGPACRSLQVRWSTATATTATPVLRSQAGSCSTRDRRHEMAQAAELGRAVTASSAGRTRRSPCRATPLPETDPRPAYLSPAMLQSAAQLARRSVRRGRSRCVDERRERGPPIRRLILALRHLRVLRRVRAWVRNAGGRDALQRVRAVRVLARRDGADGREGSRTGPRGAGLRRLDRAATTWLWIYRRLGSLAYANRRSISRPAGAGPARQLATRCPQIDRTDIQRISVRHVPERDTARRVGPVS